MKLLQTLNLALAVSVVLLIAGGAGAGSSKVRPKNAAKNKPAKTAISLDDIELDDAPAKPKVNVTQSETVPDAVRLILAAADMHEHDKDFAAVITTLNPKIDQLPRKGLLQLARAFSQTKDPHGEIHALELVIAKNPKDYVAQSQLGDAYMKVKRYDDAATAYGSSRELNSRYRPAYEGAWSLLEAMQETSEARNLVHDIIKMFGPDAKMTAALCRLYSGEGFVPDKSVEVCQGAIKQDPKNPENYVYLTQALRDSDQKPEADKAIANAAQRFPASDIVQNLAGDMKSSDKSYAESYRYFGQAVKANPNSTKAQVGLAKAAFELQKHGESIDAFVRACKLDRKTTLDFRQAATTLKKNKDPKWMNYQNAIDTRCD